MLNKLTKIKRLLLIGKEIWHNKRSMRGRFIIYLLSLVLLAGSAMLILLNVIGIVQPPSHDIDRFLEYELNTHTNDIILQLLRTISICRSSCRMISTALCWSRAFTIITMP